MSLLYSLQLSCLVALQSICLANLRGDLLDCQGEGFDPLAFSSYGMYQGTAIKSHQQARQDNMLPTLALGRLASLQDLEHAHVFRFLRIPRLEY
jgi:hypothetical protein